MIRILVVDDAPTARELLGSVLGAEPDFEVVGLARDGAEAVEAAIRTRPDLVVIDLVMRGMNGLEASREILAKVSTRIVIVSAIRDLADVREVFAALEAGALMAIPKPAAPLSPGFPAECRRLVAAVRAMAELPATGPSRAGRMAAARASQTPACRPGRGGRRLEGLLPPRLIGVTASCGGPSALARLLAGLGREPLPPVLVVQHFANGFVAFLAEWLDRGAGTPVRIARDQELPEAGTVLLAPDGQDMGLDDQGRIALRPGAEGSAYCPSGDVLLSEMARHAGDRSVAVILSGMGQDGLEGARRVSEAGGIVMAQDEATCSVFGMPRVVVEEGLADRIGSPEELAKALLELAISGRP